MGPGSARPGNHLLEEQTRRLGIGVVALRKPRSFTSLKCDQTSIMFESHFRWRFQANPPLGITFFTHGSRSSTAFFVVRSREHFRRKQVVLEPRSPDPYKSASTTRRVSRLEHDPPLSPHPGQRHVRALDTAPIATQGKVRGRRAARDARQANKRGSCRCG